MGWIEKYGSGIARILNYFSKENLPTPEFSLLGEGFQVTIFTSADSIRLGEGVSEGVSEGVNNLLMLIKETPGKRMPHFAKTMNIPEKTIERWLKILRERGEIVFKGAPKTGGYWEIETTND